MRLHFDTCTLTNFYEKERKTEISEKPPFANTERDLPDALDFTGEKISRITSFHFNDLDVHAA